MFVILQPYVSYVMWRAAVYYRNVDISDRPIIGLIKKRRRYSTFMQLSVFLHFNSLSTLNNLGREVKSNLSTLYLITFNHFFSAFLPVFLITDHQHHPRKKQTHQSTPSWYDTHDMYRFDCMHVMQKFGILTFLFWQLSAIGMSALLHCDCCSLHADSIWIF